MSRSFWIAIILSIFVVVGAFVLWYSFDQTDLRINEVGDFLAGVVSALALVWLVIGYWLQKQELSLQLQELKESTTTQKEQKEAMIEQAKALDSTSAALKEFAKPYVTAHLYWDGHSLALKIRNDGLRSALDIVVDFDPPLNELIDDNLNRDPSVIQKQPFLAPFAEHTEEVGYGPNMFIISKKDRFHIQSKVAVTYSDEGGNTYDHRYDLKVEQYVRNTAKPRTVRKSLHSIVESLGDPAIGNYDSLRKNLHKISATQSEIKKLLKNYLDEKST